MNPNANTNPTPIILANATNNTNVIPVLVFDDHDDDADFHENPEQEDVNQSQEKSEFNDDNGFDSVFTSQKNTQNQVVKDVKDNKININSVLKKIIDLDKIIETGSQPKAVLQELKKLQNCLLCSINTEKLKSRNQLSKYSVLCSQVIQKLLFDKNVRNHVQSQKSKNIYDLSTYNFQGDKIEETLNCVSDGYYFCIENGDKKIKITNPKGFLTHVLTESLTKGIKTLKLKDKKAKTVLKNLNSLLSVLQANSNLVKGNQKTADDVLALQVEITNSLISGQVTINKKCQEILTDLFISFPTEFAEFMHTSKLFDLDSLLPLEGFVKTAMINMMQIPKEGVVNDNSQEVDLLENQNSIFVNIGSHVISKTKDANEATYLKDEKQDKELLKKLGISSEDTQILDQLIMKKLEEIANNKTNKDYIIDNAIKLSNMCTKLYTCMLRPEEEFNTVYNNTMCNMVKNIIDSNLPGYRNNQKQQKIFDKLSESKFIISNYNENEIERMLNGINNYCIRKYNAGIDKSKVTFRQDQLVPAILLGQDNKQHDEVFVLLNHDYKIPVSLSKRMYKVSRCKDASVYAVKREEYTLLKCVVANLERKDTIDKVQSIENIKAIGFNNQTQKEDSKKSVITNKLFDKIQKVQNFVSTKISSLNSKPKVDFKNVIIEKSNLMENDQEQDTNQTLQT